MSDKLVDKEKIRTKIQIIEESLKKLNLLEQVEFEEFVSDFRNIETAKHLLQVSIEAMVDIANHIIARLRLKTPKSRRDSFLILQKEGVIDEISVKKYILMTKFRNRVVHLYYDVDSKEVYEILQQDLGDFKSYIRQVVKFLNSG